MIRFEHVTKTLGDKTVLDDLDLQIRSGEIFVLVGPSGTGKSVTLKHMVRLMTPDEGRVWVGDEPISEAEGDELQRLRGRFGYLFQGGALLAWLTLRENVALPLQEKTGLECDEIDSSVSEALGMVGLEEDGDKYPAQISGGMQKRASLARAIIQRPEIVLYDEPTSGLDPVTARLIDRLIKQLNTELGVTSVVVTHDLHSALSIGTRIAMLDRGRIVELSPPAEFIDSKNREVQLFLDSQFITRKGSWENGDDE